MPQLILVRHGQSLWNLEDRFTGWVDVPLTPQGRSEAQAAAQTILKTVDIKTLSVAYTSALSRAQETLALMQSEFGKKEAGFALPVIRDSALNERHYGDLQGLNKTQLRKQFGDDQVKLWRRSYDTPPPKGESLKDTAARTLPFFTRAITGDLAQGKNVLVVAHGNSLRSIIMALDKMTPEQILEFEIGTGRPIFYDLEVDGAQTPTAITTIKRTLT